ncbi:MAG: hypothetical protein HYV09_32325 [Deltaproteobacteria bacterium]|nr:hypothetical protein [Deltaproteobacteria bacterium]
MRSARPIAIALALASARLAMGDAGFVELTWNAPDSCPDRAYVLAEVARLLGDVHAADDARVRADAMIVRAGATLRLTLATRVEQAAPWERKLESPNCKALADSAALIIALAVNPSRAGAAPPAVSAPSASVAAAASSASAPPPASAAPAASTSASPPVASAVAPAATAVVDSDPGPPPPAREPRRSLQVTLGVAPAIDIGTAPVALFGPQLTAGVARGLMCAELAAMWAPDHTRAVDAPAGARATFTSFAVAPRAGIRFGQSLTIALLLGLDVAAIAARGDDVTVPESSRVTRVSGAATGAFAWALGGAWFLRADATLLVPTTRPRYFIERVDLEPAEVHRTPWVTARLSVGLELRL